MLSYKPQYGDTHRLSGTKKKKRKERGKKNLQHVNVRFLNGAHILHWYNVTEGVLQFVQFIVFIVFIQLITCKPCIILHDLEISLVVTYHAWWSSCCLFCVLRILPLFASHDKLSSTMCFNEVKLFKARESESMASHMYLSTHTRLVFLCQWYTHSHKNKEQSQACEHDTMPEGRVTRVVLIATFPYPPNSMERKTGTGTAVPAASAFSKACPVTICLP